MRGGALLKVGKSGGEAHSLFEARLVVSLRTSPSATALTTPTLYLRATGCRACMLHFHLGSSVPMSQFHLCVCWWRVKTEGWGKCEGERCLGIHVCSLKRGGAHPP